MNFPAPASETLYRNDNPFLLSGVRHRVIKEPSSARPATLNGASAGISFTVAVFVGLLFSGSISAMTLDWLHAATMQDSSHQIETGNAGAGISAVSWNVSGSYALMYGLSTNIAYTALPLGGTANCSK